MKCAVRIVPANRRHRIRTLFVAVRPALVVVQLEAAVRAWKDAQLDRRARVLSGVLARGTKRQNRPRTNVQRAPGPIASCLSLSTASLAMPRLTPIAGRQNPAAAGHLPLRNRSRDKPGNETSRGLRVKRTRQAERMLIPNVRKRIRRQELLPLPLGRVARALDAIYYGYEG